MSDNNQKDETTDKNMVFKSFRVDKAIFERINDHCDTFHISFSNYIREALIEKLNRTSIEQNLTVKADTRNVEQILMKQNEMLQKQIAFLTSTVDTLQKALMPEILQANEGIKVLLSQSLISTTDKTEKFENTTEIEILKILKEQSMTENDLKTHFSNMKLFEETLKELKNAGKITKEKGYWRLF